MERDGDEAGANNDAATQREKPRRGDAVSRIGGVLGGVARAVPTYLHTARP